MSSQIQKRIAKHERVTTQFESKQRLFRDFKKTHCLVLREYQKLRVALAHLYARHKRLTQELSSLEVPNAPFLSPVAPDPSDYSSSGEE